LGASQVIFKVCSSPPIISFGVTSNFSSGIGGFNELGVVKTSLAVGNNPNPCKKPPKLKLGFDTS